MELLIKITQINDFIFCPISIYFHNVYSSVDTLLYQNESQFRGKEAHSTIDYNKLNKKDTITGIDVYSNEFNLIGKIDIYDSKKRKLIERKREIKNIYDGYIFQLYAQYYCMLEMGYEVETLELYSLVDNKSYKIELPENNLDMDKKFKQTLEKMYDFDINQFKQDNEEKCKHCVYEPACDRSRL